MVDMTLNDLYAKVKAIHIGTNQFLYAISYRLSIVTFALYDAPFSHNTYVTDRRQTKLRRRTQHCIA